MAILEAEGTQNKSPPGSEKADQSIFRVPTPRCAKDIALARRRRFESSIVGWIVYVVSGAKDVK